MLNKDFTYIPPKLIQDLKEKFDIKTLLDASQKMNTPEEGYGFLKGCLYMIQQLQFISKSQCADGEED